MTFEEVFLDLEKKNKGEYKTEDFKVMGIVGSSMPVSKHQLILVYNTTAITIHCDLGNHNLIQLYFSIPVSQSFPEVKIYSVDNFLRLFNRKKTPWRIKCKEKQIKKQLSKLLNDFGLTKLADETRFEPEIMIRKTRSLHEVKTSYYLGFDNKEESIEQVLEFNKALIDYMLEY